MKIKEDIRSISYIKANAADILKQVNKTHRPIYITQNGEAKAVLMDADSYEKMNSTIGLLKLLSQGEKNIREGKYSDHDEFFDSLENKLDKMK